MKKCKKPIEVVHIGLRMLVTGIEDRSGKREAGSREAGVNGGKLLFSRGYKVQLIILTVVCQSR